MDKMFDLTVIGGGPGGYVAAIRACQLGLKVAVVEEKEMGGTCLNRGCIPTKSLLHSAEVYQIVKTSIEHGVLSSGISFDYEKIAAKKEAVIKQLRKGVEFLLKSNGCSVIKGKAVIRDKNTIEISGDNNQRITTDQMIIATGSIPTKPRIPGIDSAKVLSSDKVLKMAVCPQKIIIMGGGVIGVEFATLFNSLDKDVTIIEMMDAILPGMDTEISSILRKSLENKGVKIFTGAKVISIKSEANVTCVFDHHGLEKCADGDIVIVATGRKPNSAGFGLQNVGVETDRGFIKTDERMETSVKGIYAVGDIAGKALLAHVASAQGLVAAANAAGKNQTMDYSIVPGCIYTSPEIASVGLTEEDAVKKGYRIKVGSFPVSANGKSLLSGESIGLAKIITDATTGEILGAHVLCQRASDIISEICLAKKLESTIEEVATAIHPHPTISEIIMEAAADASGMCIHKHH